MIQISTPILPQAFVCLMLLATACGNDRAQQAVDDAIETHGGSAFESFTLDFDFRGRHYTATRKRGMFSYSRSFQDSTGQIKDVLTNDGFTRYRNGSAIEIPEERKQAFTRSVNSVIYFALLPFGLNDPAVNKQWVEETVIRGEPYEVVRVTFDEAGGGEDHMDVFLYWFHKQRKTMDYFAYLYKTEEGGLRFREAINPRKKGGILLQDYINYKPADENTPLDSLKAMFVSGRLQKLSEIRMENASVTAYSNR